MRFGAEALLSSHTGSDGDEEGLVVLAAHPAKSTAANAPSRIVDSLNRDPPKKQDTSNAAAGNQETCCAIAVTVGARLVIPQQTT